MKVNGTGPGSTDKARDVTGTSGAGAIGAPKNNRRGGKTDGVSSNVAERVAISSKAKDAAKAQEAARSAPDVDEAKVARLKAAIQGGSYKVDADKIADRLVDEHLATAF